MAAKNENSETANCIVYVTPVTWQRLNAMRTPGRTMNAIITTLLDTDESKPVRGQYADGKHPNAGLEEG
jgi:hypothetical protein